MRVVGIGQCTWDLIAIVPDHPPADAKVDVLEWHEDGGGPAATALVALARFGASCAFAGVRGDDVAGDRIAASLSREGIDISGLVVRTGEKSQLAFVSVARETAKRTIFCRRPSGSALAPDEVPACLLDDADFLLVDGTMPEAAVAAAMAARRRGIPVMVDAGTLRPGLPEMMHNASYVAGPETFFHRLGWDGTGSGMSTLRREYGNPVVTVTLGEKGSLTWGDEFIDMPAFAIRAVDTTGAGDVFHGGYIYGLLRGWNLRQTVEFASAVAALSCTALGGRQGIPTMAEAMSFIRTHRGEESRWGS